MCSTVVQESLCCTRGTRDRNKVNNRLYNFTTTCDVNDVSFVIGCLGLAALEVELGGAVSRMIKY